MEVIVIGYFYSKSIIMIISVRSIFILISFLAINFCLLSFKVDFQYSSKDHNLESFSYTDTSTQFSTKEELSIYDFAFKFEMGVYNILNKRNDFNSFVSLDNSFGVALNKWNVLIGWSGGNIENLSDMILDDNILSPKNELSFMRNYLNFSYSFDLIKKLSFEPFVGVQRFKFYPKNDPQENIFYSMKRLTGLNTGLSAYFYFYSNANFYPTSILNVAFFFSVSHTWMNYKILNPNMENNHFEFKCGFAIKPFIRQKRKK